ncbi:dihydropteroate synthase [Carbonactinospora thermoautotrophica]|uniref:dihydropteroate synthase n=1 Tax=Carbonactinospora thermoautotrophica TaxID=1469144 RepID=UPI00227173F2|nr:dihydropteroate synthase [Carbonactinospora thermoautotrophica]MCX9192283.1 dihydropteroate synthase [Carbonactinospora thermoautotrophica]
MTTFPTHVALDVHAPRVKGLPDLDRCLVMSVLNVTPDSFSDGGLFFEPRAAVARGLELLRHGADIIDVGGESTRPGALRVSLEEEMRRVIPVVSELVAAGAIVSIDTMRARVAEAAVNAGARMVNDVSGGLADPLMPTFVAEAGVPYVLMHWRAHSLIMQRRAHYDDVVADVAAELRQRLDAVIDAGVSPEQIVLDPGLGFAKTAEHNWRLLAHLDVLQQLGRPLLIGASRKSFLGELLAGPDGQPRPVRERDVATAAVSALAAAEGAWGVRVHDVRSTLDAVRVAAALRAAR